MWHRPLLHVSYLPIQVLKTSLILGTPAEISSAVCYLNSPAAAYITGTTLNVDGGSSLYSPPLVPVEGIISHFEEFRMNSKAI